VFILSGPEPAAGDSPDTEAAIDIDAVDTIDVDAMRQRITEEAGSELVSLNLGDASVSLFLAGSWKGRLNANWGIALTPLGAQAISGEAPLLFAQEVDLTLSLWINDRWFVEAGFLDDYSLNTYRAGYQGLEGEPVQYIGVGNTGLDFPAFPYLDLGGDLPSSFGFYGRFGGREFTIHSLIRYDMAAREERVFVGGRERAYSYGDLAKPLRGVSFVLPDDELATIPAVYISDSKGPLTDSQGRKWRLAEASEYAASARYGIVELTLGSYTGGLQEPEGLIAVSYSTSAGVRPWQTSLGTYGTPGSPGSGFLGNVQDYFDLSGRTIDLAGYPQCGGGSPAGGAGTPGETSINGVPVLVVYEKGTFSPYERLNRYRSPAGVSEEAALTRLSTGERVRGFEAVPVETETPAQAGGFSEPASTQRGDTVVYELVRSGESGPREEGTRWPLAGSFGGEAWPELYLPGKKGFSGDLGLRFTNYGSGGAYYIGNDVVPGSVQVFRSGIADPNFRYNPSDGSVSLTNPPSFNETIRITFLKRSEERRMGSIAAGAGAVWNPPGAFSSKLGIGLRWNTAGDAFSEAGAASPGTAGLGAEARWDYDRLKTGLTLGLGFEQPDTTGLYRVAGMEGNDIVLSLPPGNSFISETPSTYIPGTSTKYDPAARASLAYRNYRETSVLGTSSLTDIESNPAVVSGQSGPYPAMDKTLSSQVLAAEFELSAEKYWTGFETALGIDGAWLEGAKEIQVPFRLYAFEGETDKVTVLFQAGALADKDSGVPENRELIMEKTLYPFPPNSNPPIITLSLTDEDRVKLKNARYLRILVSAAGLSGTETVTGRALLAPPVIRGSGFRPVFIKAGDEVTPAADSIGQPSAAVIEHADTGVNRLGDRYGSLMDRLHPNGGQRVLELAWENLDKGAISIGTGAGADIRLNSIPLDNYRKFGFFVKRPDTAIPDTAVFRFVLGRGPQSPGRPGETAMEARIPLSAFTGAGVGPGQWAKVELRYRDGTVFIDGTDVTQHPGVSLDYRLEVPVQGDGLTTAASWMGFFITPDPTGTLPDGSLCVDEVILEEAAPSYRLNTGGSAEWRYPGTILSVKNIPLVGDFAFLAAVENGARGDPFDNGAPASFGTNGRTRTEVSLLGIRVAGDFSYTWNTTNTGNASGFSWKAGHDVSRSFGPVSLKDTFNDAPDEETADHKVSVDLSTAFRSALSGEVSRKDERSTRTWNASAGFKPGAFPLDISTTASAAWTENTVFINSLHNYGVAWVESWEPLVPDWGAGASARNGSGAFNTNLGTLPLGAVLSLEASSVLTKTTGTTRSFSQGKLDLPWQPEFKNGLYSFVFSGRREFTRDLYYVGEDFRDDAVRWGESFRDALPLFYSIPFHSLFYPGMAEKMGEANAFFPDGASPYYSRFTDSFETSVRFPPNYGFSSFFLPSRVAFGINRRLEQKMDVPLDTLSINGNLRFDAVNMFGAFGVVPLFRFYQSDEFTHSIEASTAFPKNEKVSWRVQAAETMSFRGFAGAVLAVNNTFTVNSASSAGGGVRITESVNAAWTVPVEKSLLSFLYSRFTGMLKNNSSWLPLAEIATAEYERLRIETLEFVFEHEPAARAEEADYNRFSITAGHESVVRITGRLNLSVFAKLSVSEDFRTRILSFLGSIGTSLSVSF
jgi:hypothetical protein